MKYWDYYNVAAMQFLSNWTRENVNIIYVIRRGAKADFLFCFLLL